MTSLNDAERLIREAAEVHDYAGNLSLLEDVNATSQTTPTKINRTIRSTFRKTGQEANIFLTKDADCPPQMPDSSSNPAVMFGTYPG